MMKQKLNVQTLSDEKAYRVEFLDLKYFNFNLNAKIKDINMVLQPHINRLGYTKQMYIIITPT